jgi:hypothetical protein
MAGIHIEFVQDIYIRDGVACVSAKSDGDVVKWYLPLPSFRAGVQLANAALALHDHPRVTPLRRGKG